MNPLPARRCMHRTCLQAATVALKLCVPVDGPEEGAPPEARGLLGVELCDDHLVEANAQSFLETSGDLIKRALQLSVGEGVTLLWDQAEMRGISIHSPEFLGYQKMQRQGKN